ncbi:MAG TPA: HEAT repeat domain-containing protein [Planctomycetes bacterium]|nr:HEAT repeat domain-containing protein [Planctomycetota bacterium]
MDAGNRDMEVKSMRRLIAAVLALTAAGYVSGGEILDNEKLVRLVKAGLEEDTILRKLDRDICNFALSTDEIEKLKSAGVSDRLILSMMDKMDKQVNRVRVEIEMLVQTLRTSDPEEYRKTIRKLKAYGADAVPILVRQLTSLDNVIRAGVAEALGEISDVSSRSSLIDVLNDDHPPVRAKSARAVANMADEETVGRLLRWVSMPGRRRDGAALALGYLREKKAIAPLTTLMNDHLAAEDDRASAAFALGLIGDVSSLQKLIDVLLATPSDRIRETTADAIGRIGPYYGKDERETAAKALTRAYDRYPQSRAVVARVLGDFRLSPVIETLIEGLQDANPEVADACHKSLRSLTGETLTRSYEDWRSWWEASKLTQYRLE